MSNPTIDKIGLVSHDTRLRMLAEQLAERHRVRRTAAGQGQRMRRSADRRTAMLALVSAAGPAGVQLRDVAGMFRLRLRDVHPLMCDLVREAMIDVEVGPQSEGDHYILRLREPIYSRMPKEVSNEQPR
jgi:hypothetical protein